MEKRANVIGQRIAVGAAVLVVVAALAIMRSGSSAPRGAHPPASPIQVAPIKVRKLSGTITPAEKQIQVVAVSPPFTLTASMENGVLEGQPVMLALALHNGGTKRLMIGGSAFEASSFHLTLTDGTGRPVPQTAAGDRVLTPPTVVFANATVMIDPGQTLQYRFNLAELFDLSRAGDYVVSAGRTLAPWPFALTPPKQGNSSKPEAISLTVGPLKFRIDEDAAVASGPTALTPLSGRQTFLYMASQYDAGISRYRLGADGSLSFAFDPKTSDAGHAASSPTLGAGSDALVTSPDGRFLYAGCAGDNTVSQFRIGDDGVLSPLSPPKVPAGKFLRHLLIDPKGRFLYAVGGDSALYAIGLDGRLTLTTLISSDVWAQDRDHNVVPSDVGAIDSTGTFLYACNGLTYVYRLASDGRVTALPTPASSPAGPNGGRENAIALSPTGKFAYVGVSTENGTAYFDRVVPMRVEADGSLTPIPGQALTPQPPSYPKGFQPPQCSTLTVDPTGRYLIVLNSGFLDCYRIEQNGSLTSLGMTKQNGGSDSVFFVPGNSIAYVHSANPASLLAYRLDDKHGLIPAGTDMPDGVPFDASMTAASAPTSPKWGQNTDGMAITVSLLADVLPASGPVVLTLVLKNMTSQPISLGKVGSDLASFRLSLVGPQRSSPGILRGSGEPADAAVPLLAAGHDLLDTPGTGGADLILPPNGERQYRLVLSRLADFTVAGNYTIQVSRLLPSGAKATSQSVHVLLQGPLNCITQSGNAGGLDVL